MCGKKLYNDIVPNVMNNRKLYPQIGIREFLFNKVPYDPKIIMEALINRSDNQNVPNTWSGKYERRF